MKLFEPNPDEAIALNLYNMKLGFYNVGINLDNITASLVLKRYDSNFDGELTFSDVSDMFAPRFAQDAYKEFERRSIYLPELNEVASPPGHRRIGSSSSNNYTRDYIKDVFNGLVAVELIAYKIKKLVQERPSHTLREALNLFKHRE